MAKVIIFSRFFPAYHEKAGQPTYFVEKILKELSDKAESVVITNCSINNQIFETVYPKKHTIRAGNRWKVGDKFSPRVWSGNPYKSKQNIISEDIEIKQIWDIEIDEWKFIKINGSDYIPEELEFELSKNDGLTYPEFFNWFQKLPFKGQIICWDSELKY